MVNVLEQANYQLPRLGPQPTAKIAQGTVHGVNSPLIFGQDYYMGE